MRIALYISNCCYQWESFGKRVTWYCLGETAKFPSKLENHFGDTMEIINCGLISGKQKLRHFNDLKPKIENDA